MMLLPSPLPVERSSSRAGTVVPGLQRRRVPGSLARAARSSLLVRSTRRLAGDPAGAYDKAGAIETRQKAHSTPLISTARGAVNTPGLRHDSTSAVSF